jgi:hypothetical protein
MKVTPDGSIVYVDFKEKENVDPPAAMEEAKVKAPKAEFVEIYQRSTYGESVRDHWLSTWRLTDGVRIRP